MHLVYDVISNAGILFLAVCCQICRRWNKIPTQHRRWEQFLMVLMILCPMPITESWVVDANAWFQDRWPKYPRVLWENFYVVLTKVALLRKRQRLVPC